MILYKAFLGCTVPQDTLQRTRYLQYNFILHIISVTLFSQKKAVLLLVPPPVRFPSAHPVSDVGCLWLLHEQAGITVQTNRGLFFIPSARRVVSPRSLWSSRCAAEGWPEHVVAVGGERWQPVVREDLGWHAALASEVPLRGCVSARCWGQWFMKSL